MHAWAVDKRGRFWWGEGVKFLPVLRPLVLLASALTLNGCDTPANRRELYNTSEPNGAWHDYARRREAEAEVGLPPGSTSIAPATTGPVTPMPRTSNRPTPQPRSGPLQTDPTSLPSTNTPAPGPGTTTTVSPAAAPAPVQASESVPTGSSSEPAAPPAPPQ